MDAQGNDGCSHQVTIKATGRRAPELLLRFGEVGKLSGLHPHVAELAEVLVEAGNWKIFNHGCSGDQAVHKMDLCSLEAVESV